MIPRQITHRNINWVLTGGFGLVIVLLFAAAFVGLRNIRLIQDNAESLVREQAVTNRLIDELQQQQRTLSEVFSILARDPDSVDYDHIMGQLDEADRDISRISSEGAATAESVLWMRLRQAAQEFSGEARHLLTDDNVETYATVELFQAHEAFVSVVGRLIGAEYRKVSAAQRQIDRRSSQLFSASLLFAVASMLLALVFAAVTVRMVSRLVRELEWQTAELSRVSWHMLEDQEATARRFSHELHDELGQSLTAVKTNLTALEGGGHTDGQRLEDCKHLVDEAIGNVRQMSQLLRPTILDDFGLEAGLRWLCDGFGARTGIAVDLRSSHSGRLPDETETHLYRIAQEALTNVARHSGAKHVRINLEARGDDIHLSVEDDGCGLPAGPAGGRRGMGMIGMRARARSAGGDVSVRSRPGLGVVIEVRVPMRHETYSHTAG